MTHPIDIFQVEATGVCWVETAPNIEHAKARVKELAAKLPGEYVVLDQKTGHKIVIKSDDVDDPSGPLRSRNDDPNRSDQA